MLAYFPFDLLSCAVDRFLVGRHALRLDVLLVLHDERFEFLVRFSFFLCTHTLPSLFFRTVRFLARRATAPLFLSGYSPEVKVKFANFGVDVDAEGSRNAVQPSVAVLTVTAELVSAGKHEGAVFRHLLALLVPAPLVHLGLA